MTVKAIETFYNGYRFRSRLEARWAVFLDACNIDWEYEPEGFELSGDRYLPDFRVTRHSGEADWLEVKPPGKPTAREVRRLASLGERAYFLSGPPGDAPIYDTQGRGYCVHREKPVLSSYAAYLLHALPAPDYRTQVPYGPLLTVYAMAYDKGARFDKETHARIEEYRNNPSVAAAYRAMETEYKEHWAELEHKAACAIYAARSARFEFGESGSG